ncbi:MAG: CinA family protein [Succinivibrionaceae bacterium]|nr:CinA family protein [Succinivibrionaceae bacterium]
MEGHESLRQDCRALALRLRELSREGRNFKLATAESLTGGMISSFIVDVPGSSAYLDCSFVTYSNAAKTSLLGVAAETIQAHGAVSAETARAMAEGALSRSGATVAVSVTGIAGPDGGSAAKPLGTVWIGLARAGAGGALAYHHVFPGDREAVRLGTAREALRLLTLAVSGGELPGCG